MSHCPDCGTEIFSILSNGDKLPFEDKFGTILHQPHKSQHTEPITKNDHVLLTHTISRVSAQERMNIELKKELDELKKKFNELKKEKMN